MRSSGLSLLRVSDSIDDNLFLFFCSLQRTSIQRISDLKRVKKRKSAPVLNEICEEQELEEHVEEPSFYHTNFHPSGRHSISTSSPSAHPHRPPAHSGPRGDPGDPPPKSKSPIVCVQRTGKTTRM